MKAIQTQYKGYHFRSRLEVRWAVFFDALCLEWEYEPDNGTWYLPDFALLGLEGSQASDRTELSLGCYVEVKPTEEAIAKAHFEHGALL